MSDSAAEQGCINGYPDGTMRPDNPISREAAATIIMYMIKLGLMARRQEYYR
ncbi:MAG: S-layer homology domain-containing protein [Peptostreptococcaceae bacterium]|nr:S-layer homology domain-containing protein [Peptostreptococcaceae bacterium]